MADKKTTEATKKTIVVKQIRSAARRSAVSSAGGNGSSTMPATPSRPSRAGSPTYTSRMP